MSAKKPTKFSELRRKQRDGALTTEEAAEASAIVQQFSDAVRIGCENQRRSLRDLWIFIQGALWGARASRSESVPESAIKGRVFKVLRSLKDEGTPRGEWGGIVVDRGLASRRSASRFILEFEKENKK